MWHRSQQGILTDCLDEEGVLQVRPHYTPHTNRAPPQTHTPHLVPQHHRSTHQGRTPRYPHAAPLLACGNAMWQCRVADVYRGLKEGMEADLDHATQRLCLPEHAADANTEVRRLAYTGSELCLAAGERWWRASALSQPVGIWSRAFACLHEKAHRGPHGFRITSDSPPALHHVDCPLTRPSLSAAA